MILDLGDIAPLSINIYDSTGALANATSVSVTIYLPDGTTTTGTVTNPTTGQYNCDYTPTQVGRYVISWSATGTNAASYTDEFSVRDIANMGVVSLDEVKSHLNIPLTVTTDDEELRRFMDAATDLAEGFVGQVLGRRTITSEKHSGSNYDHIKIRKPSILSVTSLTENGVALTQDTDYVVDPTGQRIYRIATNGLFSNHYYGYWAQGVNNVVVTYVAGFTLAPAAARQGVLEITRHLWTTQRGNKSGTTRSQSGDDFAAGGTHSLTWKAEELLQPLSLPGMI